MTTIKNYVVEYTGYPYGQWVEDPILLTLKQAKKAALDWFSYADTIGGMARIKQVSTGKRIEL